MCQDSNRLLKKKEVAAILAISCRELDRYRDKWHIQQVHLTDDPKSLRFIAEDVQRFIRERLSLEEQNAL